MRARRKTKSFFTFWRLVSERSTSGGVLAEVWRERGRGSYRELGRELHRVYA